jgi:hypothetical protein
MSDKKVCKRCGLPYENSIPPITNPKGSVSEIATDLFCADCNR